MKSWVRSFQLRRLAVMGSVVFLSIFLVSLSLFWSARASEQITVQSGDFPQSWLSTEDTISIEFFYNGNDLTNASIAADIFANLLSQETGLDVHALIQSCEADIVEHLGTGQADLALLNPVAYVLGHEAYGIEARLVNGRFGQFGFRGQINVQATSGYTDIWGLQGTRFAYPYPGSTSGYFAPYLLISETTGMTPTAFFGEVNFVGSHDQVIKDVYNGTADCGASYEDARSAVVSEYPDVYDVVNVLTYTKQIPNDPWVFRAGLDGVVVQTLANGIMSVADTSEGQDTLEIIFGYRPEGVGITLDSAYDITRDLVTTFGLQMVVCNHVYLPIVFKDFNQ